MYSRQCHQLALDILGDEPDIDLDRVPDLAAELESFASDWVQTEKLRLKLDNLRRMVEQPLDFREVAGRICGIVPAAQQEGAAK